MAFGFILFSVLFFLSQAMVVGLAVVKIFRLWFCGIILWVFVRRWSLVFSLAEMFRLWSLFFLFPIFLVLLFRLCQAIVCGLVFSVLLCCCMLLCQAVVFGLVLSLLCQAVLVFGLAFCRAAVFVLVLFPFNFWVWLCCG